MNYEAIIVASGRGTRTGLPYNKIFYKLKENTIIEETLLAFLHDKKCQKIILVVNNDDINNIKKLFKQEKIMIITGGETRQQSVYNGLKHIKSELVLIHDGCRPYLNSKLIDELLATMTDETTSACIPIIKPTDTVKLLTETSIVKSTIDRQTIGLTQTPQAFKTNIIKQAHEEALKRDYIGTDDSVLIEEMLSLNVLTILGSKDNIKITTAEDLARIDNYERKN